MFFDSKLLKEVRTAPQSMFWKDRVTETRFHEALDRFRVIRLHHHMRRNTNFLEKTVDNLPYVAAPGVEQEGSVVQFGRAQRADVSAFHFFCRGADDEKLFIEERDEIEVDFRNGKRNEHQVEPAIEEAGNHLFRHANWDSDLRIGVAFSQLSERAAKLVDERGNACRKMEWADILR